MMPSPDDDSYQSPFRGSGSHNSAGHGDPPDPPADQGLHPSADLPVIDLRELDPAALASACREWGAFRLANHGIPPSLTRRLHDEARRLLSLPFEDKRRRFDGPIAYFWGTPAVTQSVRDLNWVEGLHIPLSELRPQPPGGEPGSGDSSYLRALAEEYGSRSAVVARSLFEPLAEELRLGGELWGSYLSDAGDLMRLYRYPRCPDAGRYLGMDAHTDSSVLTMVSQDEAGGLQVRRGHDWLHVDPVPCTLVVYVGDMLQAMSDDEYRSAEHRVLASGGGKERLSVCYFAFPPQDVPIRSSRYREFTYREFRAKVEEDTRAVGFKVGLERFRISHPT